MKEKYFCRRILSGIISFLMCCAMFPSAALAAGGAESEPPYGITSDSQFTAEAVTDETALQALKNAAECRCLGGEMNDSPPFSIDYGKVLSPFTIQSDEPTITFTMDKPTDDSVLFPNSYEIIVRKADDPNSPVFIFPTEVQENSLKVTIPVNGEKMLCAVADSVGTTTTQNSVKSDPEKIMENAQGNAYTYSWTFQMDGDTAQRVKVGPAGQLKAKIHFDLGDFLVLDKVSLNEDSVFELGKVQQQTDGSYIVALNWPEDADKQVFKEDMMKPIVLSISATLSHEQLQPNKAIIVTSEIQLQTFQSLGGPVLGNVVEGAPIAVSTFTPAVTITPADLTIYQGGDGGYDAVVDGSGNVVSDTPSLPHPLFKITAPSGTSINPAGLTFTTDDGSKSWKVKGTEAPDLYYFESVGAQQDPVRVTYTDKDGNKVTSDKFDPTTVGDVYAEYDIDLYPGENELSQVKAKTTDGTEYPISVNSGKLTVRAVAKDDPTSDVVSEITSPVAAGSATAVAPAGTSYTLNNTGVELPDDSKPSLLFDDIIEDSAESTERTDALKAKVDEKLNGADANRHYEIKYLDLVDANNGNAWITSSAGTDIYWGYPEGTSQSTEFTLLHFAGLHRDGQNSGYEVSDINSATVERVTDVENTPNGIKFHVGAGGFSPFALVWTESTGGGGGGTTYYTITATADDGGSIDPSGSVRVASGRDKTFTITADEGYEIADVLVDGESVGAVSEYTFENVRKKHTIEARFEATGEIPVKDPDETGVSDWLNTDDHIAYMSGYPEGDFRPDVDMTRAEAAQMFYNLLLDKDTAAEATFSDVPANAWYAEAVNALASIGVIEGIGDNQYAPDRAITRAEFTAIAMRFADLETGGENIFSDVAENAWYYDYVVGSIQYGWINGYPDGTFRPENTISRVEVTTIVNRMLGRSADEDFVDSHADELRQFTDVNDSHWGYYNIMEAANAHDFTMENNTENWTALR